MKKNIALFIFLLLIALALVVENPTREQHEQKIRAKFSEQNPVSGSLGAGILLSKTLTYEDHHIFSYMTFNNERVSIGVLGMVWVSDLDF